MTKSEELAKLSNEILEAKVRLNNVSVQIGAIDRELAALKASEMQYTDNLNILRSGDHITVASEYRKVMQELTKTQNRIDLLRKDRISAEKILKSTEQILEKIEQKYDTVRTSKNNLIQGNFKKK